MEGGLSGTIELAGGEKNLNANLCVDLRVDCQPALIGA